MRLCVVDCQEGQYSNRLVNYTAVQFDAGIGWIEAVRTKAHALANPRTIGIFIAEPGCDFRENLLKPPISDVRSYFPTSDAARRYLYSRRWPGTGQPQCDVCGPSGRVASRNVGGEIFRCYVCGTDFSIRTGTIMHRSHLPFNTWLYAIALALRYKGNITSLAFSEWLELPRRTGYTLLKRIRQHNCKLIGEELTTLEKYVDVMFQGKGS